MKRRSSSPGHRDHRPAASNGGAFDLSRETLRQINTVSRSLDAVADMIAIRERQLQQALRDAAAAARAKAEFLANMSHELRTPLNSIIGFAALIRDGSPGDPECVSDYAAAIETSGLSLLALLNDLLDLSQLGDDALALEEQPVDLARIIADCIEAITACARKSGVTLHLDLAPHLPWIIADPVRIEQILRHLLSNAIKFTPAGGIVSVSVAVDEGIALSVQDNGIGMAPRDVGRALEPFEQVDGSLVRRYPGAGLGLTLVKRLVELHGGALSIETASGVGTVVRAHLPAARIIAHSVPATEMAAITIAVPAR